MLQSLAQLSVKNVGWDFLLENFLILLVRIIIVFL